jgi:signal peptidase I
MRDGRAPAPRSRRVASLAGWAVVAAVVVLAWPVQLGGRLGLVVVAGHSMDGTYRTGDLLTTWRHSTYDVGDVAVYRIADAGPGHGMRVVHRIIGRAGTGFVMQGDNRNAPDSWHPVAGDMVGRPFGRIPGGGLLLRYLFNPLALAFVCGACVFLIVVKPDDEAATMIVSGSGTVDVPILLTITAESPAECLAECSPESPRRGDAAGVTPSV